MYDNYNALAIGWSATDRASGGVIVSVAAYATGVNLYFMYGAKLADPEKLLQGSGNQGRFIRLDSPRRARRAESRGTAGRGDQRVRHAAARGLAADVMVIRVGVAEAAGAGGEEERQVSV